MDRIKTLLLSTMASLFVACSMPNDTYNRLVLADSLLLEHNNEDSALSVLKNIEPKTDEDSAYYNILKTAIDYNKFVEINTFDDIDFSIKYYTRNHNVRNLAYAYYYKSLIYFINDWSYDDMFLMLKNAEQLAETTTDYRLLDRIYSAMSVASGTARQPEVAVKYAHKELFYSKKLNDNYCLAYSYLNLSTMYSLLNKNDSAHYYILQSLLLIESVEDEPKANFYTYIGEAFMKSNPLAAEKYFLDALKYSKRSSAYFNLSKLYYSQNQYNKAETYRDSALIRAWPELKTEIFSYMAERSFINRNIEQFKDATDSLINTQKEISNMRETNKILELQRKFDYEKQQAAYNKKCLVYWLIISVFVAINIFAYFLYRQRIHKMREKEFEIENQSIQLHGKIMSMTLTVEVYKAQIAELKAENQQLLSKKTDAFTTINDNDYKIFELQEKIDLLDKQKYDYLEEGKRIYQRIRQNQTITMFDDKWVNCAYYFTMQEGESLFDGYNKLTINDKIFIIADDFLNKTDKEISKILAISTVTVRSRRSKIRRKKKVSDVCEDGL